MQIIHTYKQGDYQTVEGYVENFVPASDGGEDEEDMEEESFDIKGFISLMETGSSRNSDITFRPLREVILNRMDSI